METQGIETRTEGVLGEEAEEFSAGATGLWAGAPSLWEESRGKDGRNAKSARYIKMQSFILIKDIVALDEMRLKFMKQGQDLSRGRLLSEAIRLLAKEVSSGKFEIKA